MMILGWYMLNKVEIPMLNLVFDYYDCRLCQLLLRKHFCVKLWQVYECDYIITQRYTPWFYYRQDKMYLDSTFYTRRQSKVLKTSFHSWFQNIQSRFWGIQGFVWVAVIYYNKIREYTCKHDGKTDYFHFRVLTLTAKTSCLKEICRYRNTCLISCPWSSWVSSSMLCSYDIWGSWCPSCFPSRCHTHSLMWDLCPSWLSVPSPQKK